MLARIAGVLPAAVVAGLALESGGYFPRAWVWSSVVLLWLAALVLVGDGRLALDRTGALYVGAAVALSVWTLVSVTWSVTRTQSVLEARRDIVYIAGALVVLVGAARIAGCVLAAIVLTTIVGLARFLVSGPAHGQVEGPVLSWPVGYANAFGALAAIGLPLALATAAHGRRAELRAAAAASVPLLLSVLVLASSRGGASAAVVALACLGALDIQRRALAATAVRLVPAAAITLGVCLGANLTGAATHLGLRRAIVGVGLLVAAVAAAAVVRRPARGAPGRPLPARIALAGLAVGVVIALVLSAIGGAGVQRNAYWRVARHVVSAHPALGAGAGGFGPEWFAHGAIAVYGGALDVHNLYLETLAELGPLGLLLLLVFLGLPLTRFRTDAVAASAYIAFLVHALLDWDWEMPAVTLAAVLLGGSLLLPQRGPALSERTRFALAAAAVALALAALVGLRSHAVPGAAAGRPAAAPLRAA